MEDRISQLRGLIGYHNIRRRTLAVEMNLHPKYVSAVLQGRERCPADFPPRVEAAICSIVARRRMQLAEVRRMEHEGAK